MCGDLAQPRRKSRSHQFLKGSYMPFDFVPLFFQCLDEMGVAQARKFLQGRDNAFRFFKN